MIATAGAVGGAVISAAAVSALHLPADSLSGLAIGTAGLGVGTLTGVIATTRAAQLWPREPLASLYRSAERVGTLLRIVDPTESRLFEKLDRDLDTSPLPQTWKVRRAVKDISLKVPIGTKRAGKFLEDLDQIEKNFHPSVDATTFGRPSAEAIDTIKRANRALRVNTSIIEPAIVVAFIHMAKETGIPLELHYAPINGVAQIDLASSHLSQAEPFDVMCVATAPFLYFEANGAPGAFQTEYRATLPIHKEEQFVLRKKTKRSSLIGDLSDVESIRFLEASSAEEQFVRIRRATGRKYNPEELHLGDLPTIGDDLEDIEAAVMYEPAASIMLRSGKLIPVPRFGYELWIMLFLHEQVTKDSQLARAIVECFVAAWAHCAADRPYNRQIIKQHDGLLKAFQHATFVAPSWTEPLLTGVMSESS